MALSKIIAEGVDLTDDYAFTGTVTGAGEITASTTAPSEGGAATTNVVQGLAKMWCRVNYSGGTPVASDSLNVSSLDDDGTGDIDYNFTNNPSSLNCSTVATSNTSSTSTVYSLVESTANIRTLQYNSSGSAVDQNNSITMHGDLA